MQIIKKSRKDSSYILSLNSMKVQYYILVDKIRLIISETIIKTQFLRLLKLKQYKIINLIRRWRY